MPDYYSPKDFHHLAIDCSNPNGEDTVHYMHTMNWPMDVKGASFIDLILQFPEGPHPDKKKIMSKVLEAGREGIKMAYAALGLDGLFHSPPIDVALNIVDFALGCDLHQKWLDAWIKDGSFTRPKRQVCVTEVPNYSTLKRANSTFFVAFTYDPDINFNS